MSNKAKIKKPVSKVSKKGDKPVIVEAVPAAKLSAAPEVTTAQPVGDVEPRSEHLVKHSREQQNGVTKPRKGKCGDVWEVCDELLAAGTVISFEAIRAELPASIADATIKTQRQRHRKFHGLGRTAA